MSFLDAMAAADAKVLGHLGATVRYAPEFGAAVDVVGIFDAAYLLVNVGNAAVQNTTPAVWLQLADLPTDPDDDDPTITVGGTSYKVREAQRDGTGGVLLLLREVP